MNRNAANALLKILEEPPRRALLLLVAHSPGRLLPTIRSRCRRFPLAPLPPAIVRELLRALPARSAGDAHADALTALAGGSIGRALELAAAGGVALYRAVLDAARPDAAIDLAGAARLCRPARPRRGGGRLSRRRGLLGNCWPACSSRRRIAAEARRGEAGATTRRRRRPRAGPHCARRSARASPAPTRSTSTASRRSSAPSLRSSGAAR